MAAIMTRIRSLLNFLLNKISICNCRKKLNCDTYSDDQFVISMSKFDLNSDDETATCT
jgi:hypothetical protein